MSTIAAVVAKPTRNKTPIPKRKRQQPDSMYRYQGMAKRNAPERAERCSSKPWLQIMKKNMSKGVDGRFGRSEKNVDSFEEAPERDVI